MGNPHPFQKKIIPSSPPPPPLLLGAGGGNPLWESKNHNINITAPKDSNVYMYNHVICIMNCPKVPTPHKIPGTAESGFIRLTMPSRQNAGGTDARTTRISGLTTAFLFTAEMIRWKVATLSIHKNNI